MVASDLLRAVLIAERLPRGACGRLRLRRLRPRRAREHRRNAVPSAEAALTPQLVRTPEELGAANVVASAIESTGIFIGPALGGLLLAWTSVSTTFLVTAGGVAISAVLILRIRPSGRPEGEGEGLDTIRDELLEGFRAIFKRRSVALLVGLFAAQTFVDGLLSVLIAVVALDYLSGGASTVGWLNAASGIGGLVGAGLAGVLVGRGKLAADFGLGVVLFGLPLALLAGWKSEGLALVLLAGVGIGNTLADVGNDVSSA